MNVFRVSLSSLAGTSFISSFQNPEQSVSYPIKLELLLKLSRDIYPNANGVKDVSTPNGKSNRSEPSTYLESSLDMKDVYVSCDALHLRNTPIKPQRALIDKKQQVKFDEMPVGAKMADVSKRVGRRTKKKLVRSECEKTAGADWFGMTAPELTEEKRHDLEVLQMRSCLDPKRFYKKNDRKGFPKYFQIGEVLDSPYDYYSSENLSKRQRKRTLVDELMEEVEFKKFNKRKFKEIIQKRSNVDNKRVKRKSTKSKGSKWSGKNL